jgi:hypothetical protein
MFQTVLIALIPIALLVANLQEMTTNQSAWTKTFFKAYLYPESGSIIAGRPLMRFVIQTLCYWSPWLFQERDCNLVLQCLAVWAGLAAVFLLAVQFMDFPWAIISCLLCAVWLGWTFLGFTFALSFPYDLPALAFSAAGLAAIVNRRFDLLLVILGVGTLNKETIYFLIPAFAAHSWIAGDPARRISARVLISLALCAVIYLLPRAVFADTVRSGSIVTVSIYEAEGKLRIVENLRELVQLPHGYWYENVYWGLLIHLPGFVFLRRLPPDLKALYAGVPFFVIPTLILGNIWEVRIFNELLPLSVISAVWLLYTVSNRKGQTSGMPA